MTYVYQALLGSVVWMALARCAWLVIGLIRAIPVHRRARTRKWGFAEILALAELPLFLVVSGYFFSRPPADAPTPIAWLAALVGCVLAVSGVFVSLWSIYTTLRAGIILDAGHYIKGEHPLVTTGAYGLVRNPMYLGVFLIWLGLAMAFRSPVASLLTVLYVIPSYLVYMRSEERMMLSEFGPAYERYRGRVGMVLPKRSQLARSAGLASRPRTGP